MQEKELLQISSTEADKLIDEAAEFLVEFMKEFNAIHQDPDAHQVDLVPKCIGRLGGISVNSVRPYFEQLCSLTLAREYIIVPGRDEQDNVAPSSATPANRASEMEAY